MPRHIQLTSETSRWPEFSTLDLRLKRNKQMHEIFRLQASVSQSANRKSKACPEPRQRIENPKWPRLFAIFVALTMCGARAEAQQPTKVPRIGYLNTGPRTTFERARTEAFRQRLRELGYIEGKDIVIEWRYAD